MSYKIITGCPQIITRHLFELSSNKKPVTAVKGTFREAKMVSGTQVRPIVNWVTRLPFFIKTVNSGTKIVIKYHRIIQKFIDRPYNFQIILTLL